MEQTETIRERIQRQFDDLTRAERQLANSLLENYPVSGLSSITLVAQAAGVSTPTVARMVQKLGFRGFPHFQETLRQELSAKISNPIEKHDSWAENAPDSHILNRFTDAVIENLRLTLNQIDTHEFESVCSLLANQDRTIYVSGGRITRTLADYLCTHLQMLRPGVSLIGSDKTAWTTVLLDMEPGDILIIFDVRRYEKGLLKLADMAARTGVEIVLFTDQWGSPISKRADYRFNARIEVPSAWDSSAVTLLLLEAIVAGVQEQDWPGAKTRVQALEELFNQTRLFRKFK